MQNAADAEARMVTYDGGNPAVLAAAGGETIATSQLASEQVEMIRGGRLRPLAALSSEPLEIEGLEPIPSINQWLPEMDTALAYFGIFIPKGVPQEVYDTVDKIWQADVATSDVLQTYAREHGAVFDPAFGEEAVEKAMPVIAMQACARAAAGEAAVDPSTIGVTCEQ
jgi:tripartite-type tricarboxylate transporter receptor subunit TctC